VGLINSDDFRVTDAKVCTVLADRGTEGHGGAAGREGDGECGQSSFNNQIMSRVSEPLIDSYSVGVGRRSARG